MKGSDITIREKDLFNGFMKIGKNTAPISSKYSILKNYINHLNAEKSSFD